MRGHAHVPSPWPCLQGKIDLLTKTNMVDYAMDIYQNLHGEAAPASMKEQRMQVCSSRACGVPLAACYVAVQAEA